MESLPTDPHSVPAHHHILFNDSSSANDSSYLHISAKKVQVLTTDGGVIETQQSMGDELE